MKVVKDIFRIPLWVRETSVGKAFGGFKTVMEVDGVGVFVEHVKGTKPTEKAVRCTLVGRKETECYIEATTLSEALSTFYEKFEGAKTGGGQGPESFALWINATLPITKFSSCKELHKSKDGHYICGPETKEDGEPTGNGEWGGCVIENYDPPKDCVGEHYFEWLHKLTGDYRFGIGPPPRLCSECGKDKDAST